ncbi:MAG TPA: endonuclease/exonuclease/phosphatase family protein [Mycobacteriales bacterium]
MPAPHLRRRAAILLAGVLTAAGLAAAPAHASSPDVLLSEVYGGGGNTGAPYRNDFVELVNRGSAPVGVEGWSVQYASAGGATWALTPLHGTIAPGAHLLVQEGAGTGTTAPELPAPDVTGTIAMSGTSGRVALVTSATALTCGGACSAAPGVRDFVGYGTAADAETAPTPALSNTTSASRRAMTDTDDNAADFTVGAPTPEASGGTAPPPPAATPARIHDVQGAAHRSPLTGQRVATSGVVTAVGPRGFWLQDPVGDDNPATSEGVYVFAGARPTVTRGDAVDVTATVVEFRPSPTNLSVTELSTPQVTVTATGVAVPAPVLIGPGGRVAPTPVRTDAPGDVEASPVFDPAVNALDFSESLEGMQVRVTDAVASGPTSSFGELPVLPGGAGSPRTARGGVLYSYADSNPERVFLDDVLAPVPTAKVGDRLPGAVDGVLDYSFGNYKLEVLATPAVEERPLPRETTRAQRGSQLAVATFNVENLAPTDDQAKYDRLATTIVRNLAAPDIVAVEEIQDDTGATNDGTVTAGQTYAKLIAAIGAAGGPRYAFRQLDPVDGADGGQPGGNIRVGFLFRADRGLRFVDRPGAGATTPNEVVRTWRGPHLRYSPGRIDPANPAFADSRKPLAGEFRFRGETVFVIANHFNSKGGDQPLNGRFQPPTRSSETQRHAQAHVVRGFVDQLLAADRRARVVVVGDLNDFEFSETADILTAGGALVDLPRTLALAERYTYVFEGNSQVLDHILTSPALARRGAYDYDIVHVNSEYPDQVSDHEPQVVRLRVG